MDTDQVRLDGAGIETVADALLRTINTLEGDAPTGWAWSATAGDARLLAGPAGRLWVAHQSRDAVGLARMGVDLQVVETEAAARVGGAAIDLERLGIPAGVLVRIVRERPEAEPALADLRSRLAERWPALGARTAQERGTVGTHGGTLDRVKEARALVEDGANKTRACRLAHIDTRTYDRYVAEVIDWEDDE